MDAATFYMLLWNEDLLKILKKLGISVDIKMILRSINKGRSYSITAKKMIFDAAKVEKDSDNDDLRTLQVLMYIFNLWTKTFS